VKIAYDVLVMGRMDLEHALGAEGIDVDSFFRGIDAEMFMNDLEGRKYSIIVVTLDNEGHKQALEGGEK
jgi:hypothetical protein